MKIAIANDHTGLELKRELIALMEELGHEVADLGTQTPDSVDYPIYGVRAARAVARGEYDLGIVICGTGVGIGMSANKVKGIRCATCSEPYSAMMARRHNNANMLAMGARVVGVELAKMIVLTFLQNEFEGGRHTRRVEQIVSVENDGQIE
ncbi:MAG: ribose 5-phosphate isomerase B [Christensenellales bacterium]